MLMKTLLSVLLLAVALPASAQLIGGDRDEHGCIGSAGYTWSEVRKDCIRLFEKGIRTEAVDDSCRSAFIVFSPDSSLVELFFSDGKPNEILSRRALPHGGYVWNVEDDDTKNVRRLNGKWSISRRGKLLYSQRAEADDAPCCKEQPHECRAARQHE